MAIVPSAIKPIALSCSHIPLFRSAKNNYGSNPYTETERYPILQLILHRRPVMQMTLLGVR